MRNNEARIDGEKESKVWFDPKTLYILHVYVMCVCGGRIPERLEMPYKETTC